MTQQKRKSGRPKGSKNKSKAPSQLKKTSKKSKHTDYIERRALCFEQSATHPLYVFALSASEVLELADVSRISRDSAGKLIGYQRAEVKKHIREITEYVNGESAIFPNAIILALSSETKFTKSRGPKTSDGLVTSGTVKIPVPKEGQAKPAWIVDGQQRTIALSKSKRTEFPVPIAAFVADDIAMQREQFLLINNTRPLPRGLVDELLPEVSTPLPSRMAVRKIPSELCGYLNQMEKSPFYQMMKRPSSNVEEKKKACITDTSIIKMLQESLTSSSGCLFPYRNIATGETDIEGIWQIVTTYWCAVRDVFPDAWGKQPSQSRLMHGVGIRSVGRLMDKIMASIDPREEDAMDKIRGELELIAPACSWTKGVWEGLGRIPWNSLENNTKDIKVLSNFLIRSYVQAKVTRP